MPGNHSADGNVFVQLLPAKCVAIQFKLNLFKSVIGCLTQYFESISGKADDSPVGKF